ncbi:uncharacterized protein LOC115679919 [Syzygium oleosum]|uniref:uncharacterized protein LOC115679919 n=1 Tax=Syzygium oleosum TaxID=219896 RepID=UPI0024BB6BA2|nr:uncharacterized protein LOC115679919 [Syzygium oleosum]
MAHAISINDSETSGTPNERLEALKARYVSTPGNQQQLGDDDLNKIMDRYLYEATKEGNVEEFIGALENVSKSRKLALSLIFDQVASSGNSLLHVAASSGKDDLIELILDHFPYLVTRKNFSEDTTLHVAVRNGSLKATEMLIRRGTNSEIKYWKNKDRKSPLYLAVEICKICDSNPEGVGWKIPELLVREFARDEAYAVKIEGMSPVLATFDVTLGLLRIFIDRLPKLLHVRGEDGGGGTPLHAAASVGYFRQAEVLLRKCPYLALQTDKNGSYLIHIACEGSSFSTFENTLAMYCSILAVVVLLWGLSRDFYVAELAYHSAGPLLLMPLTGMSVAFFAAITVAVSKLTCLGSLVLSVGVLYLAMVIGVLAALIFPSSKSAMRIVVFYYLAVTLSAPAVRGFVRFCVTNFPFFMEKICNRPFIHF